MGDIIHIVGKTEIKQSEVDNQINEILQILKTKKQTYAVNKFVLEETILKLQEIIMN